MVQHPPTGPGGREGPTAGLGAHAHSAADGPQAHAKHRGPGAGRPATAIVQPPYPAAQRPGEWKSGTTRNRGLNPTSLAARYPETTRSAPPPRERDPGTIVMMVLENGHYYQVRIIPHPQRGHWSLEAVDSMLLATTALPDSLTPLLPDQPWSRLGLENCPMRMTSQHGKIRQITPPCPKAIIYSKMHTANIQMLHACVTPESNIQG